MIKFKAIKNLFTANNSEEVMKRFLLPVGCVILMVSSLLLVTFEIITYDNFMLKLIMMFVNNFLALTSLKLYSESNKWDDKKYFLWSGILFLAIMFISLSASKYELFSLTSGLVLSIMFVPFLGKKVDDVVCCNFKSMLVSSLFFALAVALMLIAGTSVILASISYLFSVEICNQIYKSVIAIYLSLFIPLYILSSLPGKFNSREKVK